MRYPTCSAANKRRDKIEALKRHQQRRQQLFQSAAPGAHPGDLIDQIQAWWPDCPAWASSLVDRLGNDPAPEFVAQVSAAFTGEQG